MKKIFHSLTILSILITSCEGPTGTQGPLGPVGATGAIGPTGATGAAGKDGTNGTNGKDGTSSTARYYDYELNFSGITSGSDDRFEIPNFNFNKEYCLTYVFNDDLVKPVPGFVAAKDLLNNLTDVVDMQVTYTTGTTGLVFLSDFRYRENGKSRYKFRTIIAPLVAGGRLAANSPYELVKEKYDLPD